MGIRSAHSFLVYPAKTSGRDTNLLGTHVSPKTKLFRMLEDLFDKSHDDCPIEIVFRPGPDGTQANAARNALIRYLADPNTRNAEAIAERLQSVTTRRSGLGLLFLMVGDAVGGFRVVLARFPADQGVVANEGAGRLQVEFLERVFMKSAFAYKSAVFDTRSPSAVLLGGRAVDKQIDGPREISDYWVRDFLDSEFQTTPAAGTRRLANAIRAALSEATSVETKTELLAGTLLARGFGGTTISPRELAGALRLSPDTTDLLLRQLAREELTNERFVLDVSELDHQLPRRSVELDNGALMMSALSEFDSVFVQSHLEDGRVRFSTEGRVVDQAVRRN